MADTAPKPFVFVLMPFAEEFDDVYQFGIKRACENVGTYAERVDEQLFEGGITGRVYNQISKADVIVADMTGRNANVFYEVGYAHALGKSVVLLSQDAADIPFDLKDYPHIVYRGKIHELLPELEKRVRWCVEHEGRSQQLALSNITPYFRGHALIENPTITFSIDFDLTNEFGFTLDVNNSVEKILRLETFQFSLVTPPRYTELFACQRTYAGDIDTYHAYLFSREGSRRLNLVLLPDARHLYILHEPLTLYPGAWASWSLLLSVSTSITTNIREQFAIRINTESAIREYPFDVQIVLNQAHPDVSFSKTA